MPAQTVIKIRRDTSTNWASVDPTLGAGEIAFETDTNKIKVGDGSTAWSSLDYASGAGTAAEITYDNTDAALVASNVKAALDELSLGKADIGQLSTNLAVYATTATSDISGYSVLVNSMDDDDYDDTVVNVATGLINADDQLIASLAAPAGLFEGHVDAITVTTIGDIRKTAGNQNKSASFYFEVYIRNAAGTETLVGTSGNTGEINPPVLNVYQRFSDSALVQFGDVIDTDRVVIKFYGNVAEGAGANYDFQFGGTEPVRTLIPVPANVVVAHEASGVIVDTSNFDGILSGSDDTVQAALETIDDFEVPPGTVASDTAPSSPEVGQLWWDSSDGTLYIYYDSYWVQSVTGVTGPRGSDNIVTAATAPADTDVLWIDTSEDGDAVLPLAGTTGQVLSKVDGTDYNTEWTDASYVPAVGTDDQVLTVVSGEPAWADAGGGGDPELTLLASGSIPTGATTSTLTGLSGYDVYYFYLLDVTLSGPGEIYAYLNGTTTGKAVSQLSDNGANGAVGTETSASYPKLAMLDGYPYTGSFAITVRGGSNTGSSLMTASGGSLSPENSDEQATIQSLQSKGGAVLSSFSLLAAGIRTFSSGTYEIYGG